VVGRTVQLNQHPFTILGITPPGFRGTVLIFSPDFFVPIVNQEQVDGWNGLNDRANRWVGAVMGHLKAGLRASERCSNRAGTKRESNKKAGFGLHLLAAATLSRQACASSTREHSRAWMRRRLSGSRNPSGVSYSIRCDIRFSRASDNPAAMFGRWRGSRGIRASQLAVATSILRTTRCSPRCHAWVGTKLGTMNCKQPVSRGV
jgi:hypothetical protein